MKRRRHCHRYDLKKIMGIVLFIMGIVIILKVIPINAWLFLFGLFVSALGLILIKWG
jgi:hypothetical protein